MATNLEVKTIEGIYQGETFSRKVELYIDNVRQDLTAYSIDVDLYIESNTKDPILSTFTDTTLASSNVSSLGVIDTSNNVVLIPAEVTKALLGWYIIKITFNIGGFITIRKARFKVER